MGALLQGVFDPELQFGLGIEVVRQCVRKCVPLVM